MIEAYIAELEAQIRSQSRLQVRGGGTKTGLAWPLEQATVLDTRPLAGVISYQPEEYTLTAWAGTPVSEVVALLAERNQYLPFDPPLGERGATLGGTTAAGISGAGRYHGGGVSDFLLGVEFIDGRGQRIQAGGQVVKNAAGFDLPKLVVGSLGMFGVLLALTFKVIPRPESFASLRVRYDTLEAALAELTRATMAPASIYALDLVPEPEGAELLVRVGGPLATEAGRLGRVERLLPGGQAHRLREAEEALLWQEAAEFTWAPEGWALVKVPLTPLRVPDLESALAGSAARRRYSAAANLAWVAWPGDLSGLETRLALAGFSGLVVLGPGGVVRVGRKELSSFATRIRRALDPEMKFIAGELFAARDPVNVAAAAAEQG